jgi:hypothetical protein
MDRDSGEKMASSEAAAENVWNGVEENMEDPEETRVIFSALDSFR